jgi:hypothetical protein
LAGSSYRKKKKVIRKPIHLFAWVQLLCVKEGYSQWETELDVLSEVTRFWLVENAAQHKLKI